MRKSSGTATIALAIAVFASACGSEVSSPGAQASTQSAPNNTADQQAGRNEQDVTFARQMIPHLSQTRDLAKFVPGRSTNPAVLDLAERIKRSQNPDIQQLLAWLYQWDEEYVHSSTDNEAVQKLRQADDAQFDRMWTQMTIERHQRVIALAKTELDVGKHLAVRQFAQKIIDTRQAEITELQKLAQP
jgi:DNA phosphorothioation-dependent restriction protein DptG